MKTKKTSVLKSLNVKVKLIGTIYHLLTYEETVRDKALYYLPQDVKNHMENKRKGYFSVLSDGKTLLYSKTIKSIPKFKIPEDGYERFEPTTFLTLTH
jgi:hypothetical protein